MNFFDEGIFKYSFKRNGITCKQKLMYIYIYLKPEFKVDVFYKHKSFKIFYFFKKIHQFLSDALVTGTKF